MKTADIATAVLGLMFGLLLFFGYSAIIDSHLDNLDAQRGVTGVDYELDR